MCCDGWRFVCAEIIHHDDGPGPKRRYQQLRDIRFKTDAVHGTVEDHWRYRPLDGERRDQGRGMPVAIGREVYGALPSFRAGVQAQHVCLGPRLIEVNQAGGIDAPKPVAPTSTLLRYVCSALFCSTYRLFFRV